MNCLPALCREAQSLAQYPQGAAQKPETSPRKDLCQAAENVAQKGTANTQAASPLPRAALGEIYMPLQPASTGWPLLGPDSASGVGPNARRWAEGQQKYALHPCMLI